MMTPAAMMTGATRTDRLNKASARTSSAAVAWKDVVHGQLDVEVDLAGDGHHPQHTDAAERAHLDAGQEALDDGGDLVAHRIGQDGVVEHAAHGFDGCLGEAQLAGQREGQHHQGYGADRGPVGQGGGAHRDAVLRCLLGHDDQHVHDVEESLRPPGVEQGQLTG